MQRFHQRFLTWGALFAMLMSALAPTISRAMGPDEAGRYLIEVCSAEGTGWVAVDAAEFAVHGGQEAPGGGDGDELPSFSHCPYCCAHTGAALLPMAARAGLAAPPASRLVPWLFLHAARPLFAWSPSHPRAPPVQA
ncbi:DUF2946 domain-containing protein [Thauera sp.]|uniref:DUF2946 domain-containing protein n=1 Tax=Thauera sp. TaxID=1905334 RepID=UPI002B8F6D81|nr:DUF2946 domain-containing protein [Thauera sp.]HRP26428.1 DUF2946 domain-containing protein [Thauera sp.]